jgi:hypothetical protein
MADRPYELTIQFVESDARRIEAMARAAGVTPFELVSESTFLYEKLHNWRAQGNHIELVEPPKPEQRTKLDFL